MTKTCNVSCRAADKLNVSFKLLSPRRGSLLGPLNRITDAHLRPTVKHPQWICAQVPPCFCRRIPTINWISLSKTAGKRKKKTSLSRPSITDIKVKTLFGRNNGCRHSPGVCVLFALPESPSDGKITGLSSQQMQTAENNIICKPRRGQSSEARLQGGGGGGV